jgi:hypothetical protein
MFFITVVLKPQSILTARVTKLGLISSEALTLLDNVKELNTVSKYEIIDSIDQFLEGYNIKDIISESFYFKEDMILHFYNLVVDYLFKLSFAQITSISLEDFLSARFLPDYHVIEYLAREAQLDRYSVSKVLVALSNLLRDCQTYDVRQINAISLRIHKAIMNNTKTVFVITEF